MTDTVKLEPCEVCGETFDRSNLAEVAKHQHAGLPLDDFMGIQGVRVKPTRQRYYKTAEDWERYASALEDWIQHTEQATRPAPKDATPAPDRDAVRALKAVYDAAEALLKEAREGCVTELEFQAILKPSGKALQTAVIDARMQALTPSHPIAGRDEVREAAQKYVVEGTHNEVDRWGVCVDPKTCAFCILKQALATPQSNTKENA